MSADGTMTQINLDNKKGPLLWMNAGELSGDIHGAALLEALRRQNPDVECIGMGGAYMRAAGQRASLRVEDLSVMGGTEVLAYLPRIIKMLRQIKRELTASVQGKAAKQNLHGVDAVVVIDAPDFNFRVIKMARKLNIPVYYYISPKIWAWRTGRVHFIKKHVKRVFSILPFEVDFYRQHGMEVDYVGNPLVDLVKPCDLDHIEPIPNRIGILPGSRRKELQSLLPRFGEAAQLLRKNHPNLTFHCVRAPSMTSEQITDLWPNDVPLEIVEPEGRYAFLRTCTMVMASSGTATLETALLRIPTLVAYTMSPLSGWLAKRLIKVKYAALPNLILEREVFPELLQDKATAQLLAAKAALWLSTPQALQHVHNELNVLRDVIGVSCQADAAKNDVSSNQDASEFMTAPDKAARILLQDLMQNA
ncbi:MAG: lipid-A-disaccharide synthase [Pseudomonadota bacterium]